MFPPECIIMVTLNWKLRLLRPRIQQVNKRAAFTSWCSGYVLPCNKPPTKQRLWETQTFNLFKNLQSVRLSGGILSQLHSESGGLAQKLGAKSTENSIAHICQVFDAGCRLGLECSLSMLSLGFLAAWWQCCKRSNVPREKTRWQLFCLSNLALKVRQGHILLIKHNLLSLA